MNLENLCEFSKESNRDEAVTSHLQDSTLPFRMVSDVFIEDFAQFHRTVIDLKVSKTKYLDL